MHMSYYTGIVFESYGNNLGVPLGSGGRYDELLQQFNRPAQAVGFGLRLDLLVEALGLTGAVPSQTCILFSPERRPEAVEHARKLRETGKRVVLQDIRGVEDVDQLSGSYEDVVSMIGKKKEGASHE
jgi:ATP phosphoribosyltransferase regulatory subunit